MPPGPCTTFARLGERRGGRGHAWLDDTLGRWSWYRRWHGGHWENWYLNGPVRAYLWFPLRTCSMPTRAHPPLAWGLPACEQYGEAA